MPPVEIGEGLNKYPPVEWSSFWGPLQLEAIRPLAWLGMGLLLMASVGLGWSCGGPDLASRKALATTTATRNVAVGLVIAASDFSGTQATAVVAYGLVSILGALGCAHLLGRPGAIEVEDATDATSD